eukprot:GILJ01006481.1.p1 GENE.GILJ01006481.1~~GILJ01006481.1.p1  ORF type:complete len:504 (+),score=106.93 GILJ01006481.1:73-1512(+)
MQQEFSFPTLSIAEIVECSKDLNIPITEEELAKPEYQVMKEVYQSMVEICTEVSKEDLRQIQFHGMDYLPHPELHEDSVPTLAFFRQLQRLMSAAGFGDVGMQDVFKPDPKRTRKILSAIINFAKFREERLYAFQEITKKTDVLNEDKQKLMEENARLSNELAALRAQREAEMPAIVQATKENDALVSEIEKLNHDQVGVKGECAELKDNINRLDDKLNNDKFLIVNVKQDIATIRSQIVQSPQKLTKMLQDLADTIEADKESMSDIDRKGRELQNRFDVYCKIEKDVAKCVRLMEECETEMAKSKKVYGSSKELKANIDKMQEQLRDMVLQEQNLNRNLKSGADKLSRLQHSRELKEKVAQEAVDAAVHERVRLAQQIGTDRSKAEETEAVCRDIHDKMDALRTQHELELTMLDQEHSRLCQQVIAYHRTLFRSLDPNASSAIPATPFAYPRTPHRDLPTAPQTPKRTPFIPQSPLRV